MVVNFDKLSSKKDIVKSEDICDTSEKLISILAEYLLGLINKVDKSAYQKLFFISVERGLDTRSAWNREIPGAAPGTETKFTYASIAQWRVQTTDNR